VPDVPNTEAREDVTGLTALGQADRKGDLHFRARNEFERLHRFSRHDRGFDNCQRTLCVHNRNTLAMLADRLDALERAGRALEQELELREQAEVDTERKVDAELRRALERKDEALHAARGFIQRARPLFGIGMGNSLGAQADRLYPLIAGALASSPGEPQSDRLALLEAVASAELGLNGEPVADEDLRAYLVANAIPVPGAAETETSG
jgi:hypothetical protein